VVEGGLLSDRLRHRLDRRDQLVRAIGEGEPAGAWVAGPLVQGDVDGALAALCLHLNRHRVLVQLELAERSAAAGAVAVERLDVAP